MKAVRYLIDRPRTDGTARYYWQPGKHLRQMGYRAVRLSDEPEEAAREAEAINRQIDSGRPHPMTLKKVRGGTGIYVIAADKQGPLKIGYSTNVRRRLGALQSAHPRRLLVHHFQPADTATCRMVERLVATLFDACRMSGEWYDLDAATATKAVQGLTAVARASANSWTGWTVGQLDGSGNVHGTEEGKPPENVMSSGG